MTRKILIVLATAGIAGIGVSGLGYAQHSETKAESATGMRGTMSMPAMMDMMRDCPMMQGMRQGPAAALQHRDSLALSDTQVQRIEAVRTRADQTMRQSMERMQSLHREIRSIGDAERLDEAAARRALAQMGELHADMGVAMLRARAETRDLLTAAQRERLTRLAGTTSMQGMGHMSGMMGMMDMMGGDMGAMMQKCPMMQGMMQGAMKGMMQDSMGGTHMRRPDSTSLLPEHRI